MSDCSNESILREVSLTIGMNPISILCLEGCRITNNGLNELCLYL